MQWVLDVNDVLGEQLLELMKEGDMTKIEFLNASFTLTKWAIGQVKQGNMIAAVNESEKKYHELQMEFFNRYRPQSETG